MATAQSQTRNISSIPAAGQNLSHNGKDYTTIKEGLAYILIPASASINPQTTPKGENDSQSVFYNPIQQFNRDLSVLAIKAYGEERIEAKRKAFEAGKSKIRAKRIDKKRKREEEKGENASRKAGKLECFNNVETVVVEGSKDKDIVIETAIIPTPNGTNSIEVLEDMKDELSVESLPAQVPESETSNPSVRANAEPSSADTFGSAQSQKQKVPKFTILDALSATGLRAIRYAHEIPFTTSVTANDLLLEATKTIKMNIEHNKLGDKINPITGNALAHMYSLISNPLQNEKHKPASSPKYDVIDLDPYGTAAPFLDAAVQSVSDDGGLLCITCTDAGVWASNGYPEKAYSLYGGIPAKGPHSHESGLRLILHAIATSAARHSLAIEPLLSLSIDFYARVFVRIHKSASDVKFLSGKTMLVRNCDQGCGAWSTTMIAKNKLAQNKNKNGYFWKHIFSQSPPHGTDCEHCGMKTHLAGPMWAGPLHNADFIKRILADLPNVSKDTYQTISRVEGMLTLALEELLPLPPNPSSPTATSTTGRYDPAEVDEFPFFFIPGVLSKVIHCVTPDENSIRGALRRLGYRVTRSHTKPGSLRTDAPWSVIWEVMREWVRQKQPIKEGALRKGSAGYRIMGLDKQEEQKEEASAVATPEGLEDAEKHIEGEKAEGKNGQEKTERTAELPKKIEVVFDVKLGMEKDVKKLVRYQVNPRENWGPMNRAKGPA